MLAREPEQSTPSDELVQRMNELRNASERHVAKLHGEADRLADWREYVKAQPALAIGLAGAVGFMLTRGLFKDRTTPTRTQQSADVSQATSTGIVAGATSFLGSLAAGALRAYTLQHVTNLLNKEHHHEGKPTAVTGRL